MDSYEDNIVELKNCLLDKENELDRSNSIKQHDDEMIEMYKNELLSLKIKNENQLYEINLLHERLNKYEDIFNKIINSKYYKFLSHIQSNDLFDEY